MCFIETRHLWKKSIVKTIDNIKYKCDGKGQRPVIAVS